jgi:hypothetical protein
MSLKNKLYTKGYFKKRLVDGGFIVNNIDIPYSQDDNRYWSLLVDKGNRNLIITCIKKGENFHFILHGKNNTQYKILIKSMTVIIEQLNSLLNTIEVNDKNV